MRPAEAGRVGTATDFTFATDLEAAAFLRRTIDVIGAGALRRALLECAPSLGNVALLGDARLIAAAAPRLRRGDLVARAWYRGRGHALVAPMPTAPEEAPGEAFVEPEVIAAEVLDAGPQEAALVAAAESGAPFCEECEKAKREQEAAA